MPQVTCLKCGKVCKNLQGWKQHNTGAHGGYDEQDLEAIAGGSSESADTRTRMEHFAATLGADTSGASSEDSGKATGSETPQILEPTERKVRATPKKLKKILGGIPAKILEALGIELDNEDHDALDEAAEFLSDVFGFEFSVPESKVKVESRWWAIVWVAGITALVYIKHKSKSIFGAMFSREDEEKKAEEENLPN